MTKDELQFINSFHGYKTVRYEFGGNVITGDGRINVSRTKFAVISENKIIFEAKKDKLSVGRLMSGDGIRVKGYNLISKSEESMTVYFTYISYKT